MIKKKEARDAELKKKSVEEKKAKKEASKAKLQVIKAKGKAWFEADKKADLELIQAMRKVYIYYLFNVGQERE